MGIIDVGTVASEGIEAGRLGSWEDGIPISAITYIYETIRYINWPIDELQRRIYKKRNQTNGFIIPSCFSCPSWCKKQ